MEFDGLLIKTAMKSLTTTLLMVLLLGNININAFNNNTGITNDSVYETVDQKPHLKGKKNRLEAEIKKNLNYPTELKLQGIEGVVIVSCVINNAGVVEGCHVEKSLNAQLDEEAVKSILDLGPWVPGKVDGQAVNTKLTIPVAFVLNDSERTMYNSLKEIDFQNKPPLFVLNGKIVDGLIQLEHYNVQSIRVIKGQKAVDKYGDRARYGVVEMTTKNGTPR